ncbi:MAG: response regulator [Spirochaetes bacterium]|nr:response regulator [Spirochaetota bacterium]
MSKNILVIDDDITILNSIQKQLKNEDFDIDLEINPLEGLKKACNEKYDLIICDIRMKPINGIDVIKKLKAENCKTPIIILTGYVDDKIIEEVNRFGSNGLLIKPVRKKELLESIHKILNA